MGTQSFRMRTSFVCSFAFFFLAIVSEEITWSQEIPTRSKVEEIEQELDKVIENKKLPAAVQLAYHDCVGNNWSWEIPTRSKVEEIEKELDKVIKKKKLPAAVRLAFHDCVGGCDGCIDPDKPANAGLEPFVKALEATFKRYENILTRADFWALTSIFALKKTIKINNQLCQGGPGCETPELNLVFKYGRKDCQSPNAPFISRNVGLPGGKFGFKETMQFFKDKFDFTGEESVALLGAHALGRAMTDMSGFQGSWIDGQEERLNNQYFKSLVNSSLGWTQEANTPEREDPHWQWRIPNDNVTFMLNPDVDLFKDIQVDKDGKSSCNFEDCPNSPTANVVQTFAGSNKVWIEAFEKVFAKMLAHGTSSLYDV